MRSLLVTLLRSLVILTALSEPSIAAIETRIIDDTKGDSATANPVVYQGVWNAKSCPQCSIQPDPAQAFDGTWTATTYFQQSPDPVNATLTFTGTAIYIFFILANNAGTGVVSKTMANITLDDQSPFLYQHIPDPSTMDLQYNALVFSQSNLENVHHSVVISVSGIQEEVYINFDYAIYTHEDIVLGASGESVSSPTEQPQIPTSSAATPLKTPIQPNLSAIPASVSTPQVSVPSFSTPASGSSASMTPSSPIPADVGTPAEPSQTSSTQPTSQHAKPITTIAVIVGGCLGGLVILTILIFGIAFIWRKRQRRHSDTRLSSVDLLDTEDGNSGHRIYAGNGNIDENGIDTTIAPFHLGPPYLAQNTGMKPPEATAMNSRDHTPPLTVTPRTTHIPSDNEVARADSGRSVAGLHRARQGELDQRLQLMQQEMVEVINEINNRRASQQMLRPLPIPGQPSQSPAVQNHSHRGPTDGQMSVDELQDTLRHMRRQIEHLQQQQQSAWAQGLSDDPPGYSPENGL